MDKDSNKPKMNVPRPNLSWLYIVIAVVMAYFFFTSDETSASKEITYTEFKEMVTKGYAEKIVAYDDNTVDMFIKPDHIVDVFKKSTISCTSCLAAACPATSLKVILVEPFSKS